MVIGSKKITIIYLRCILDDISKVLILQVHRMVDLPTRLVTLFEDDQFSFAGVNVGGDINKIGDH